MAMLGALASAIIDTIYPPACLACRAPTDAPHGLCPACWRDTHFIAGTACRSCGLPLIGATAGNEDRCDGCRNHPPAWDRGAAAIVYDGAGRRAILALKHADRLDTVPALAGWLQAAGRDLVASADLIAPVPLHWRRLLRRRYNQSGELARALGHRTEKPVVADLLTRTRMTVPQQAMNREARAANQAGAITVTPCRAKALAGKRVLIIDDVLTSGATLSACAEAARAAGATGVDVLVLARVAFADSLHI